MLIVNVNNKHNDNLNHYDYHYWLLIVTLIVV